LGRSVPEDAGGVFVDLGEQVLEVGRSVDEVVAVELEVAVSPVQGPGVGGGGVAQAGDREAAPLWSVIFTPRRTSFEDR
jgi:hypothetical protein